MNTYEMPGFYKMLFNREKKRVYITISGIWSMEICRNFVTNLAELQKEIDIPVSMLIDASRFKVQNPEVQEIFVRVQRLSKEIDLLKVASIPPRDLNAAFLTSSMFDQTLQLNRFYSFEYADRWLDQNVRELVFA